MSINLSELKVRKDAAVSALFSLWKAAGDASSATLELIDYLEGLGLDVDDLRAALDGTSQKVATKNEVVVPEILERVSSVENAAPEPEARAAADEGVEGDGAGKKKRKRAPRHPNLPKRPLNVQLKFYNAEQKRIQEERKAKNLPELLRAETREIVKERWEKLDPKVRDKMLLEYQRELENWHAQTAAYRESGLSGGSEAKPALSNDEPASQGPESTRQEETGSQRSTSQDQEGADQATAEAVETEPVSTPSKKKHRKSEGKKDEKRRRKKSADSE